MGKDVFASVAKMTEAGSAPQEMRFMASGLEFTLTIAVGFGLGYLIDHYMDCYPVFAVVGAIAGFLAGLYRLVTQVKRMLRQSPDSYRALPPKPDAGDET